MIITHDTATFTRIYNEYFGRLFAYARKFVTGDDAADVISEVFMGLWRVGPDFENDKALSCYLFRAVKHRCLNQLHGPSFVELPDIPQDEPAQDYSEILGRVIKALDELPPRQQQIIRMRLEGKSYKEIAAEIGTEYGSVKSSTGVAIKKLRKIKL